MARLELVGEKFGRLTVLSYEGNDKKRKSIWKCKCECGNITIVRCQSLVDGNTQSCGCLRLERVTKHGMYKSRAYHIWSRMLSRCNNPNNVDYLRYGGRGITVCEKWQKFKYFYTDMGDPPSKKHTIDRINNDGGYKPSNCRWTTRLINSRNTRQAKYWFIHGKRFESSTEAAKFFGVSHHTIISWCGLDKRTMGLPLCWSIKKYANHP